MSGLIGSAWWRGPDCKSATAPRANATEKRVDGQDGPAIRSRRARRLHRSRASAGLGSGHYKAGSDRATFVVLYFVHWVHRGSTGAGVHRRHGGHIGWLEACLEVLQPA